jgi:flavin-dependent dehydrogenase
MNESTTYDVAVIGGGLAGLALSIQMSRQGYSVILFEKEKYPFHKVCGEYISMESWNYLEGLGIPLSQMDLPRISSLKLTAPAGTVFTTQLPLGGFGISRYLLDHSLAGIAKRSGVVIKEQTKVDQVSQQESFTILAQPKSGVGETYTSRLCFGAFGKRSNLDLKWKRGFLQQQDKRVNNYVGVKYHIRTDWPDHFIGLHNFKDGYCGISRIENGLYCFCYMTHAENLKRSGNDIYKMEKDILSINPHLKAILDSSKIEQTFPVTISQINFSKKDLVFNGVIFLGDAAGTITPLCGNGMSMALHSSKIASGLALRYLKGSITRKKMEVEYAIEWKQQFESRMRTGRVLQRFFGSIFLSNLFVRSFKLFPFLAGPMIRRTHGKPF